MADDRFEMDGTVIEVMRGTKFRVKLDDNGAECICTLSGRLRQNYIRILNGDHVTVDLSVKDPKLEHGRIVWRDK